MKTYQNGAGRATDPTEAAVPAEVSINLAEAIDSAKEGLLALAVGTGLQVMQAMFDRRRAAVQPAGPAQPGPGRLPARSDAGGPVAGGDPPTGAHGGQVRGVAAAEPRALPWHRGVGGGWRWSGCSPGFPRAATRSA